MRHFSHNIGDYAAATAHLPFIEDAAYHRLLRRYYQDEKPLPGDVAACCRLVGARTKDERTAVSAVLAEFFHLEADGYHQHRADREIEVYRSRAKDGAKGAAARWGIPKETAARKRSQRLAAARVKATHTKEEWAAVIDVFDARCVKCGTHASELIGGTICKDHVIGVRNGGDDGVWNLQPMCRPCNTAKGQDGDWRENALPNWQERLAKRLAKCVATNNQEPRTKNPDSLAKPSPVAERAPREPASRSQLVGKWEPSDDEVTAMRKELPWLVGELYERRMADFRDWCEANATRTFSPTATWRGFMRKTKQQDIPGETFDQRRIRLAMEAVRAAS